MRSDRRAATLGLLATVVVASVAVCALVGWGVVAQPARALVGTNPTNDFQIMTWSLAWWPWAIRHGVDPFHTALWWAPHGFSLLWVTSIPVPALLAAPLTMLVGPLVTYNVLMLAAVVLAAAAAFLLLYELTAKPLPALLCALLFAFCPYMLGHTASEHLNLTLVFPIPLLALLGVRCARGKTSPLKFVVLASMLLLLLLGSSLELFVDVSFVALLGGVIAIAVGSSARRALCRLAGLTVLAYALCLPVFAAAAVLAYSSAHLPIANAPSWYETDLLNVFVPTLTLLSGSLRLFGSASAHFVGNIGEQDGYVGLPLLVVAFFGLRRGWRRGAWIAGLFALIAFVLSLGPVVVAGGRPLFVLPLSAADLPVVGNALPGRFSVLVTLGLLCLAAVGLASSGHLLPRVLAGAALVVSFLPNFGPFGDTHQAWGAAPLGWSRPVPAGFVADRRWTRFVLPGANVLVLPTRDHTAASYWQSATGMRFGLAMPETPFVPPEVAASPTVARLARGDLLRFDGRWLTIARLRAFIRADHVGAVVVSPLASPNWVGVVRAAVGTLPTQLNGSAVFRVTEGLRPLHAEGEFAVAYRRAPSGSSRAFGPNRRSVTAWLTYDGWRAHVAVRFDGAITALSSPRADAESPVVAIDPRGGPAVVFTEWRRPLSLLRAASYRDGSWRVATLARSPLPILSLRLSELDGVAVTSWISETGPLERLNVAVQTRNGRWLKPRVLEQGIGLGSFALASAPGPIAVLAWQDQLAALSRVRASVYAHGLWSAPQTITSGLMRIDSITVDGAGADSVGWRAWRRGEATLYHTWREGDRWQPPLPWFPRPLRRRALLTLRQAVEPQPGQRSRSPW